MSQLLSSQKETEILRESKDGQQHGWPPENMKLQ